MSAAAIARHRLLRRPVSDAQRQAARRNGAKLHPFTPDEAAALQDETRFRIEAFRPAGPVALASFQLRRIDRIEVDFQTRNPQDSLAIACLIGSLGIVECRYDRLLFRCLCRLDQPDPESFLANEPGNSLKQNKSPVGQALPPATQQRYTETKVRPAN